MTGPALLEKSGAQSKKQTAWAPIFIETLWPGLVTNRNALHSWGTGVENAYGLSRPGVLIGGLNTEVTVRNTMGRRPGNSLFSTVTYPTPPARSFAFQLLNGTIQVLVDTSSTGSLSVTSVAASTGTSPNITAVFTGVFPNGGSNAYAGLIFTISGFTNTNNNGSWVATASTTTTLTLTGLTTATTVESAAASAVSTGAVYVDNQNGTKTLLFAKSPGAGQTAFIGEAGIAYFGDGVDTRKYTPGNPNGTIWNWGIVAPTQGPTITITESASASTPWQANTVFSTMGLVIDSVNNVVYQLQNINYSGTNNTRFATTGTGQPVWNQNPGMTTSDNGGTWTNFGPIVLWTATTEYAPASPSGGTFQNPCAIYDPITKAVYLNGNESGPGRSGATVPKFIPSVGKGVKDGSITWFYMGPGPFPNTWLPAHVYPALSGATDSTGSVVEPNSLANGLLASPPASPTFWQVALGGLTSAASATSPFTAATAAAGQTANDGTNIVWLSLGSDTWTAGQTMTPWTASGVRFSCIVDPLTNELFCVHRRRRSRRNRSRI